MEDRALFHPKVVLGFPTTKNGTLEFDFKVLGFLSPGSKNPQLINHLKFVLGYFLD